MSFRHSCHAFFTLVDEAYAELWRMGGRKIKIDLTEKDAGTLFEARVQKGKDIICNEIIDIRDDWGDNSIYENLLGRSGNFVINCYLLPSRFFFHTVSFPDQLTGLVDKLVDSQIDQSVPWPKDQIVFGRSEFEVGSVNPSVLVAAAHKTDIEQLGTLLSNKFKSQPQFYALCEDSSSRPIHLAHTSSREMHVSVRPTSEKVFLMAVCIISLLNIGAWWISSRLDQTIGTLRAEIIQSRAALSLSRDEQNPEHDALNARKGATRSVTVLLDELAGLLPDHTWIRDLDYSDGALTIEGLSQDPPSLIRLLERSPKFASAEFSGPTERDRDTGAQKFRIQASVKNNKNSNKSAETP